MATISLNYQATAKGRKIWAKCELAVAEALSKARHAKGFGNKQTTEGREGGEFYGSFFHTTDQMGHYAYGSEGFFTTAADVERFDRMNIEQDIDLCLVDIYKHTSENGRVSMKTAASSTSVSVKSMNKAMETGNISLELKTFNHANPKIERTGWVFTSKAEWYAFAVGTKVMMISKAKLLKVMEEGNWTVKDNLTDFARSFNEGRTYDDAQNMLIPVDDLIEHSVIMDLPDWYVTAWKKAGSTSEKSLSLSKTYWGNKGL